MCKVNHLTAMLLAILCITMSGCSGSGGDSVVSTGSENNKTDDNQSTEGQYFVPVKSDKELAQYLLTQVEKFYIKSISYEDDAVQTLTPAPALAPATAAAPAGTTAAAPTSSTNTIVNGVDESDVLKNDQNYIYAKTPDSNGVSIYKMTDNPAKTTPVSTIKLDTGNTVNQMYLVDSSKLVMLGRYPRTTSGVYTSPVSILFYDTANPSLPQKIKQLKISSELAASRRIGNTLYVVTRSSTTVPKELIMYPQTKEQQATNQNIINTTETASALLPTLQIDDGPVNALVSAKNCYVPNDTVRNEVNPVITTISSINIQNPNEINSTCIIGAADNIYASTKAMYISATNTKTWAETAIHKFSFATNGAQYKGSGVVTGTIEKGEFRMDEYNEHLRVVSSSYDSQRNVQHLLTILKPSALGKKTLETVSTLPNKNRPETIGKPRERLYGTRFIGDRAYLVTFLQTDPLYSLDLSDPNDPKIAGQLEIPGFSSYLHPVSSNLLLGIGRAGNFMAGVKISLFDISDSQSPKELSNIVIGKDTDTWTNIEFDHHALTFLDNELGKPYRFTLPINVSANNQSGLYLFEIDKDKKSMSQKGLINNSNNNHTYAYSGLDRSVIQGDAVHYVYQDSIYSSLWQTPNEVSISNNEIRFETVDIDFNSSASTGNFVIQNEKDWASFWAQHKSAQNPIPTLPSVDFSKKMLLGIVNASSGCYAGSIINKVYKLENEILVKYNDNLPTAYYSDNSPARIFASVPYCATTTKQAHVISVEASSLPVRFTNSK